VKIQAHNEEHLKKLIYLKDYTLLALELFHHGSSFIIL